jgi:hypothetical protein
MAPQATYFFLEGKKIAQKNSVSLYVYVPHSRWVVLVAAIVWEEGLYLLTLGLKASYSEVMIEVKALLGLEGNMS